MLGRCRSGRRQSRTIRWRENVGIVDGSAVVGTEVVECCAGAEMGGSEVVGVVVGATVSAVVATKVKISVDHHPDHHLQCVVSQSPRHADVELVSVYWGGRPIYGARPSYTAPKS